MMHLPNMLMIGATGRHAGKTALSCELIRRYAKKEQVVGVKITTVDDPGLGCPRGARTCTTCGSLTTDYRLTEETVSGDGKDTQRMRSAGAEAVYWLRVRRAHLGAGLAALMAELPAGACLVCESNSARHVLEPGLFLVIRLVGEPCIKASCRAVISLANRIVDFDGTVRSLDADGVVFVGGRWYLEPVATAATSSEYHMASG